ncbi:MAG TPA: YraN family protein [Trichormus sp.]|jgi:putative endonuclease
MKATKGKCVLAADGAKAGGQPHNKISFGRQGESLVVNQLQESGWRIVERNWRSGKHGEVDIIALDPDSILVFLEVKTRRTHDEAEPAARAGFDSVHGLKQHRIMRLAMQFLTERCLTPEDLPCRFDVVVVHYHGPPCDSASLEIPEVTHVKNAFHRIGW